MTGKLVPNGDPHWENFLLLLTSADYVFAPLTSVEIADYIKTLIREHHGIFQEIYGEIGDLPIIPKMHYIVHLPEWMKKYMYVIKYTVIVRCLFIMIT